MYDFELLIKNFSEMGERESAKTLAMGLPVTGWDDELQKIIKTYPDGRIEEIKNSGIDNG